MISTPPAIAFQAPPESLLYDFNLQLRASEQPSTIPKTFLDAMSVREQVFVHEQKVVPLKHHIDRDDARSFHWVLYAPPEAGKESEQQIPAGTLRLLPSPHNTHPEVGQQFNAPQGDIPAPESRKLFGAPLPELQVDRKTDVHDGVEPYVSLGRLCVAKEYRGKKFAELLISAALGWARDHPEVIRGINGNEEWKGLVLVHARDVAATTWRRSGFEIDEGMGTWFEVGIPHVGMWQRLEVPK